MHLNKQVDFLPATHKLNELLFDVKLVGLVTQSENDGEKALSNIAVSKYVVVVNAENKDVLCVVSKQYELFTNERAISFGKQAFVSLFPSVRQEDLIVYKVISSSRKTFCHIDLIHKEVNFNAWEQETWIPFLRVTNSYNRKFKFSLELGFVRKLCSNGVIFDKKTIKIKYSHTKNEIPVTVNVDVNKLKVLENEFKGYLLNLKRFHVQGKFAFPMVCKALQINWKLDKRSATYPNEIKQQDKLKDKAISLYNIYCKDQGESAFSIMNVATDLISHDEEYGVIPRYNLFANEYYHRISHWMRDFCDQAEKRDFKIESYLGEYLKYVS